MSRPQEGTPEWKLWVAAIEVAAAAPATHDAATVYSAKIPWRIIDELREALDAVGIDWQKVRRENESATRRARTRLQEKDARNG